MADGRIVPSLLVLSLFVAAACVPFAARRVGRELGYWLAGLFVLAALALVPAGARALDRDPVTSSIDWVPSLGFSVGLRLDALSVLFSALVLVLGAVIFAYTARYLSPSSRHGRLYAQLTFFAASMLGLVVAGDAVVLLVFWELTSVASFLLIGGSGGPEASRAARRALLVTSGGGLALLAAVVLLVVVVGSADLATIVAHADRVRASPAFPAIAILLLLAVATKSALFPFHFWLPGAMVAPTPVSAYLHSATMVKAGIYLLLRTVPLFEGVHAWDVALVLVGLTTAVFGASTAIRQYDLKALLAYSTVSQLGLLAALAGVGTQKAVLATSAHVVAHALYKATLFMVVGIVEREAGSRDIRELSGLRRVMPLAAVATGLAGLSMAGIPPLAGFVSKEEAFAAFIDIPGGGWLPLVAGVMAVGASALTFAYGWRIFEGAFGGPVVQRLYEPDRSFLAPALLTSAAGLVLGLAIGVLDPLARAVTVEAVGARDYHLALWHGLTPALGMSATTIVLGAALVLARHRLEGRLGRRRPRVDGASIFEAAYARAVRAGAWIGRSAATNAPGPYLGAVLAATLGAAMLAGWWWGDDLGLGPRVGGPARDWPVALLLAPAVAVVVAARDRIAAVAALGLVGFALALLYALIGAPDLAITQVLVETLTVALVVLVFRRLPRRFSVVRPARAVVAGAIAAGVGVLAAVGTDALTGRRGPSEVARYYLRAAQPEAGGRNVVNTILVDFRALDTMGEIAVLALAGLGAIGLVTAVRSRRAP